METYHRMTADVSIESTTVKIKLFVSREFIDSNEFYITRTYDIDQQSELKIKFLNLDSTDCHFVKRKNIYEIMFIGGNECELEYRFKTKEKAMAVYDAIKKRITQMLRSELSLNVQRELRVYNYYLFTVLRSSVATIRIANKKLFDSLGIEFKEGVFYDKKHHRSIINKSIVRLSKNRYTYNEDVNRFKFRLYDYETPREDYNVMF